MFRRQLLRPVLVFGSLLFGVPLSAQDAEKPDVKKIEIIKTKPAKDDLDLLIEGQIVGADSVDKVRRVGSKTHVVRLDKGKLYQIDMVGHGIDAYLRLEDMAGSQLAADDDSGGNLNARIRFTPAKTDLYVIIATTCGGGEGAYTLTVRNSRVVAVKATPMNAVDVKKPSEIQAQLTPQDANDNARGVPCKVHTISLKKGRTYTIDLISNDFDAYLRLEDPRGNNLKEDDDGGGNLNSRIIHQADADGVYRLVAMPLSVVPANNGQYLLRVTEHEKE